MVNWEGRGRHYGPIGPALWEQLLRVEPSTDGTLEHRPCRVALRDDRTLEFLRKHLG